MISTLAVEQPSEGAYLHRACPSCGTAAPGCMDMSTPISADQLKFDELIPQWNGFFKEKSIFSYARCTECGLLYAPVFLKADQLARLYAQMPPNMDEVPESAL